MVTWLQFPSNINVRYNVSIHTRIHISHGETKEITTITRLDSRILSPVNILIQFETTCFFGDNSRFLVGRGDVLIRIPRARSRVRIAVTGEESFPLEPLFFFFRGLKLWGWGRRTLF